MPEISSITTRLREADSLPDTLAAGLEAFEAVRQLARGCGDAVPVLFAAFMTTADAAVDGREAITIAPSLAPERRGGAGVIMPQASVPVEEIADALAGLGALLTDQLARATAMAAIAADRAACTEAAGFPCNRGDLSKADLGGAWFSVAAIKRRSAGMVKVEASQARAVRRGRGGTTLTVPSTGR